MNEAFSKDLCDEKHNNLHAMIQKIDKNVETLFNRLNWFFILAIGTLVSAITTITLSCVNH